MSKIETSISSFIPQQFPQFYQEDGQNFVAFIKAYYEWMEQSGQTQYHSRRLLDYADIDTTAEEFVKYFKNTYLNDLPDTTYVDKATMVKHILDLYRAKGTPRAYELLFRLLFNEDIDIFIPGEYIFKPSDNTWYIPYYIEASYNENLINLIGKDVYSSSNTAQAVVDNYTQKIVNGKTVNILYISNLKGNFVYGDKILSKSLVDVNGNEILTIDNAPFITGSLTAVSVTDGGYGFIKGDILDVYGKGILGKARVAATRDENGKVNFTLLNGGTGYSKSPIITVLPTLFVYFTNLSGYFSVGDTISDLTTSASGTCVFANSSMAKLINFTSNNTFNVNDNITGPYGTAVVYNTAGAGGGGASFKVGSLVNTEIINLNNDLIQDHYNSVLYTSAKLTVNTSSPFSVGDSVTCNSNIVALDVLYIQGSISNGDIISNTSLLIPNIYVYKSDNNGDGTGTIYCTSNLSDLQTGNLTSGAILTNSNGCNFTVTGRSDAFSVTSTGTVTTSNTTSITINNTGNYPFIPTTYGWYVNDESGNVLVDESSNQIINENYNFLYNVTHPNTAIITTVTDLSSWTFPTGSINLDSKLNTSLIFYTKEVGTIASLTSINPGIGYSSDPYVDILEPDVASLDIVENNNSIKGHNAIVYGQALNAKGVVDAVEIVDSGYGYLPNDDLIMSSYANGNVSVAGTAIVNLNGHGQGKWLNSKSFLSDTMKIQDSYYYQNFSYEIVSERLLNTYETMVKDVLHPAGMVLFGQFRLNKSVEDESIPVQFTLSQS